MSIFFNGICINEEMLPKYTIYIYIYIYREREREKEGKELKWFMIYSLVSIFMITDKKMTMCQIKLCQNGSIHEKLIFFSAKQSKVGDRSRGRQ